MSGKAPTIIDVAREAGVSIKTVSRVMNQEPGVNSETRGQVLSVITRLNYRPQQSARSLAGARSFLIGLLYYDPSADYIAGVQQGATLRCREAGYHLVVESLDDDAPDIGHQVDRVVSALRPDGMILTPPLSDNAQVLAALRAARTPCVLVSPAQETEGVASVRMDDQRAAQEITGLLLALGHRRIGFVKGAADQAASKLRYQGYLRALKAAQVPLDKDLIVPGDFKFDSGVAAATQLLARKARPTAIFASNDDMALGVLTTAQRMGIAVPAELSIAGFDDSPAAVLVWPRLTTVHQPKALMARTAVELLVAASRGDDPGQLHRVLPHQVVVRESTGAAPVARESTGAAPGSALPAKPGPGR
ncbi:MAG: LacI family DNA-binding transcriptional regulator [Rubrivivax sp.]|nr:LacI family DNA-binding transcriptional regulator [Rubrivivax sp.]